MMDIEFDDITDALIVRHIFALTLLRNQSDFRMLWQPFLTMSFFYAFRSRQGHIHLVQQKVL